MFKPAFSGPCATEGKKKPVLPLLPLFSPACGHSDLPKCPHFLRLSCNQGYNNDHF